MPSQHIDPERLADIIDEHAVTLCGVEGRHDLKWKWCNAGAKIYNVGTGRNVLVPFGIRPQSYMKMLADHFLDQGLTIGETGKDEETAVKGDDIDWSKLEGVE